VWKTIPDDATREEANQCCLKILRPIVDTFAKRTDIAPDKVCAALMTCAQLDEWMQKLKAALRGELPKDSL